MDFQTVLPRSTWSQKGHSHPYEANDSRDGSDHNQQSPVILAQMDFLLPHHHVEGIERREHHHQGLNHDEELKRPGTRVLDSEHLWGGSGTFIMDWPLVPAISIDWELWRGKRFLKMTAGEYMKKVMVQVPGIVLF